MRSKCKRGSGLYAYLASIGVLQTGTDTDIEKAKQKYWGEYRKQWKKNKRQHSKVYLLHFSFREQRELNKRANELLIKPSQYIKDAALSKQNFFGPALKGKLREEVLMFNTNLIDILDSKKLPEELKEQIKNISLLMEKNVLQLLNM